MRRSRLANPTCWPRSLRTSSSRTDWNLLAIVIHCWGAIRPSFRSSKGFGGLDGSFQKSPEFQEIRSSKPGLDSLSPYLCTRVALRYINRIEFPLPMRDFKDYILTIPEIAPDLPQGLANFFMQLIIPVHTMNAVVIVTETMDLPQNQSQVLP